MTTETREWDIECWGKAFGTLTITKDTFQEEITVDFKIKPNPSLEVRSSTFDGNNVQFVLKEKRG